MKPFDIAVFREAIDEGRIEWRKHVLQKLAERGIAQQAVRAVLLTGERIRDYADDKPFPSALVLGVCCGQAAPRRGRLRRVKRACICDYRLRAVAGNL